MRDDRLVNTPLLETSARESTPRYLWSHLWHPIDNLLAPLVGAAPPAPAQLMPLWNLMVQVYPILTADNPHTGITWNDNACFNFMELVRVNVPAGESFKIRRRAQEVLDAGNRLGWWKVSLRTIQAPLPPAPPSHYQLKNFEESVRYEGLYQAYIDSLGVSLDPHDAQTIWGRLLLSAVLFGGLLEPRWLAELGNAIPEAPTHLRRIELLHNKTQEDRTERRTWYPDPLTRNLFIELRRSGLVEFPKINRLCASNIYRLIKKYAQVTGFSGLLPRNWSDLRTLSITTLGDHVTHYLLAYAKGKTVTTALPSPVWSRLLTPPRKIYPLESIHEAASHEPLYSEEAKEDLLSPHESEDEEAWPHQLRSLASAIRARGANAKTIAHWRAEFSEMLLPSVTRLAEWVETWLFMPIHGRRALRYRTVYERFNAIAGRLVSQLGAVDPARFDSPESFLDIYIVALEDTSTSSSRRRVSAALRSFHDFLVARHHVPELKSSGILSGGRSSGQVDANFISPELFQRALDLMRIELKDKPELAATLVMIASLGYYAGLRRSEAIGLMLRDIEGIPDWDLVVSNNEMRTLKSLNAHRVLPLNILFPAELRNILITRYQGRIEESDQDNWLKQPIFIGPGGRQIKDTDPLLDIITKALIRVTGDSTFRFHHLRHSFANRILLAIWMYDHRNDGLIPKWLPEMVGFDDIESMRKQLLGTAPTMRRSLRLVTRMMGHSGTEITLESYIHILDILLGREVMRSIPSLSDASIAHITGYSESHVKRLRRQFNLANSSLLLEAIADHKTTDQIEQNNPPKILIMMMPSRTFERLVLLADVLNKEAGGSLGSDMIYPWSETERLLMHSAITGLPKGALHTNHRPSRMKRAMDMPTTSAAKELARMSLELLVGSGTPLSDADRLRVLKGFPHWWVSGTNLNVRLGVLKDALAWYKLLEALGIAPHFEMVHIPTHASKAGSAEIQFHYWETKIPGMVLTGAADSTGGGPARGIIEFRAHNPCKQGLTHAFFGIRWAILLAGIADLHKDT